MTKPNLSSIDYYAEKYASEVCDEFFKVHETINGKQIVHLTKVKQVNFFVIKIIFESWQKEAANLKSPMFDYSSEEVKNAFNSLMSQLSKHISIEKEDFMPILKKAVIDTLIILFFPEAYYENFLKNQKKKIYLHYITPLFNYIKIHEGLVKKMLEGFALEGKEVKRKRALQIASSAIENNESLLDEPQDILAAFDDILPIGIYEIAPDWEDKRERVEPTSLDDLLDRPVAFDLNSLGEQDFKDQQYQDEEFIDRESEDELEKIIYYDHNADSLSEEEVVTGERPIPDLEDEYGEDRTSVKKEEVKQVQEEKAQAITPPVVQEETSTTEKKNEEELLSIQEETAAKEQPPAKETAIQKEDITESEPIVSKADSKSASIVPEKKVPLHEKLSTEKKTEEKEEEENTKGTLLEKLAQNQKKSEIRPIKGMIPLNLKFKFQKELFGGNSEEFNEALDLIDSCSDYHSAISLVKVRYISRYEWDLSAESTIEFLSLVDKKF